MMPGFKGILMPEQVVETRRFVWELELKGHNDWELASEEKKEPKEKKEKKEIKKESENNG